jgi:hypothetical protein
VNFPYLLNWHNSKLFQRCLAELSNPPRVLDRFLTLVEQSAKRYGNLDQLPYNTIKQQLLIASQVSTPGAETRALVELCLAKQKVSLHTKLPDVLTVEDGARLGYIFSHKTFNDGMQIAIPLVYLMSWLEFKDYFVYAHKLFAEAWDDPNAISPHAWEIFNVKHTAFKLSALSMPGGVNNTNLMANANNTSGTNNRMMSLCKNLIY